MVTSSVIWLRWTDHRDLLAAHQRLGAPMVLVRDNPDVRKDRSHLDDVTTTSVTRILPDGTIGDETESPADPARAMGGAPSPAGRGGGRRGRCPPRQGGGLVLQQHHPGTAQNDDARQTPPCCPGRELIIHARGGQESEAPGNLITPSRSGRVQPVARPAPVHEDDRSGDVATGRAGEEHGDARHVLGAADAFERDPVGDDVGAEAKTPLTLTESTLSQAEPGNSSRGAPRWRRLRGVLG